MKFCKKHFNISATRKNTTTFVIPAGKRMQRPERIKAGTQVAKPLL